MNQIAPEVSKWSDSHLEDAADLNDQDIADIFAALEEGQDRIRRRVRNRCRVKMVLA